MRVDVTAQADAPPGGGHRQTLDRLPDLPHSNHSALRYLSKAIC